MESKKDISLYKTKNEINKKQDSSVGFGNSVSKAINKQKEVVTNTDGIEYNFNGFINKKTKKLTTALYMVTSFLSDNEPLKWKLRDCSVLLFSGISNVRNKTVSEVDNVFIGHLVSIDEIVSLLEVAVMSKLISEMNFSILKKEYNILKDAISSSDYKEEKSGKFIFPNEFFGENKTLRQPQEKDFQQHKNMYLKDDTSRQSPPVEKVSNTALIGKGQIANNEQNNNKRQSNQIKTIREKYMSVRKKDKPMAVKTDRKDTIIKLLKSKKDKEFTIKDISHEVSDCSEKTIQRELVSLVLKGVLKKRGERRWSRYSLK